MDGHDTLLTIGRFAEQTGLTVKALRLYDRLGLLRPATVDFSSGYRYYADTQVDDGHLIRFLRDLNMPLVEIQALLLAGDDDAETILERHRARLREEIEARRRIARQVPTKEKWKIWRSAIASTSSPRESYVWMDMMRARGLVPEVVTVMRGHCRKWVSSSRSPSSPARPR